MEKSCRASSNAGLSSGFSSAIENARFREQFFERRNSARRRIKGFAKSFPLGGRHNHVNLLGENELGSLIGMFQHEVAETRLAQLRSANKDRLLGRP